MQKSICLGVFGASGVVGRALLGILHASSLRPFSLRLFASERSLGEVCPITGLSYELFKDEDAKQLDLAFLAVDSALSHCLVPVLLDQGVKVIDKSTAFRMEPAVPLVVPEINAHLLSKNTHLVASPNCSAIIAAMPLSPLNKAFKLKDLVISSYQAASGAGAEALKELEEQCHAWSRGESTKAHRMFPHPLAFNIIPEIGGFENDLDSLEELKIKEELKKILELPELTIVATCVRVPVIRSHSMSITATFELPLTEDKVRSVLMNFPGLQLYDAPKEHIYPTPLFASEKADCFVGRVRVDPENPKRLSLFVAGDQLLKGAALNAWQIASCLLNKSL